MHLLFYRLARVADVLPSHPYTYRGTATCAPLSSPSTCSTTSSKPLDARLTTDPCASVRLTSHSPPTFPAHHLPLFPLASQRPPLRLFCARNGNLLRAGLPRHGPPGASAAPGEPCGRRGDAVVPGNVCALYGEALYGGGLRRSQQLSVPQQ